MAERDGDKGSRRDDDKGSRRDDDKGSRRDDDDAALRALRTKLAGVLKRLPEIERKVVELRMGLVDGSPAKHKEVADQLGLTIHEVRKIEERAISRIREVVPVQGLQRFLNR